MKLQRYMAKTTGELANYSSIAKEAGVKGEPTGNEFESIVNDKETHHLADNITAVHAAGFLS